MKRLLIVGAGFLQSFIIKKAKEEGYYVIAVDKNPNSIGFKYADEQKVIDIVDYKLCYDYAKTAQIDGVITAATDYGVLTTSYIAENLKLPGLKFETAKLIKNKFEVRKRLFESNVDDVNQYFEVSNFNCINAFTKSIKLPVMVKPVDGSGSKGATKVTSKTKLKDSIQKALKYSLSKKVLIEDYIEGKEYGIESFVFNNKIHVLGILDKSMTKPPAFAEMGHSLPVKLEIENKIMEVVSKTIKVLGINFGSVNMDVLVTKDNSVCVIDIGARMGGNLIGSHLIPIGSGYDYMKMAINASLGEKINVKKSNVPKSIATKLLVLKPGVVKELPNFRTIIKKYNVDIYHQLKLGSKIKKYENNLDAWGYIVSISDKDVDTANKNAINALNMIDLGIIRE